MDFTIESLEASKNATFDVDVGTRDDGAKVGFRIVGLDHRSDQIGPRAGVAQ